MPTPARIAALDTETTGDANPAIIEIGVLFVEDGREVDRFETLINPGRPLTYLNQSLSGITDDMVRNKPLIGQVLPDLFTRLDGWTLLGHNIDYDLRQLNTVAATLGLPVLGNPVIDLMRLGRERLAGRQPTLLDLSRALGIADVEEHRALSDAIQTYRCYEMLQQSDTPLAWSAEMERRSRQTKRDRKGMAMRDQFLKDVDTTPRNAKPEGEELLPQKGVWLSGTTGESEFLASYGNFAYLWACIDIGEFPSGKYKGEPTFFVAIDGRRLGYLSHQTATKYVGRIPDHAVCLTHTKVDKASGRMRLRVELPMV